MAKTKPSRNNYYILLSLLIHLSLFVFIEKKEDVTLGEKIIPIEVFENSIESGVGEDVKRSERIYQKNTVKDKKNQKTLKQMSSFKGQRINKNIKYEKVNKNKSKNNKINQTMLKEETGSGAREGLTNNEPEKGSLMGKGRIKVTCLRCIRPIYPPAALRKGAEGNTIIKIWINKIGKVTKAEIRSKSGIKSIDNASIKAAINSTFYPLEEDIIIDIEYNMQIR